MPSSGPQYRVQSHARKILTNIYEPPPLHNPSSSLITSAQLSIYDILQVWLILAISSCKSWLLVFRRLPWHSRAHELCQPKLNSIRRVGGGGGGEVVMIRVSPTPLFPFTVVTKFSGSIELTHSPCQFTPLHRFQLTWLLLITHELSTMFF